MFVLQFSSLAIYYFKLLAAFTLLSCICTIHAHPAAKRLHDDLLSDCKFAAINKTFIDLFNLFQITDSSDPPKIIPINSLLT